MSTTETELDRLNTHYKLNITDVVMSRLPSYSNVGRKLFEERYLIRVRTKSGLDTEFTMTSLRHVAAAIRRHILSYDVDGEQPK